MSEIKHPVNLPTPVGFKILVVVPKFEASDPMAKRVAALGIVLSDGGTRNEEAASVALQVVAIGSEAYKDKTRFPDGPWCKVGDYVLARAYSGTRFFVGSGNERTEYRFLNDDSIEGVATDLTGISRI